MKYPEVCFFDDIVSDLHQFDSIIDVRSPSEFAEDHIPGAINCPVLNDEERIRIGTMYKQVGAFEAKRLGAALVAINIGNHLTHLFQEKPKEWRPLIYCWRGGNRSGSMAHIFSRIGWPAAQLHGGYKAYRQHVNENIPLLAQGINWKVLCGPTGSAKSRLLAALNSVGQQVLDLEKFACHRGSVLGDIPNEKQPSQKHFESRIWETLRKINKTQHVYVEAESKKVGNLRVPDSIMEGIRAAACISLKLDIRERVNLLVEDYAHFVIDTEHLGQQLDFLTSLHGKEKITQWKTLASQHDIQTLVRKLLEEHYDPAYHKSINKNFSQFMAAQEIHLHGIDDKSMQEAIRNIVAEK